MKSSRFLAALRLVCHWSALFPALAALASTNDHVVLITIDGCAAYYLRDPAAPLPTLRKLAEQGASAEGMKVANPAITWPNHTTLLTGVYPEKHSVLFNGVLRRPGGGFAVSIDSKRDKSDLVAIPTLFDFLHEKGYRTAGINWPCTRHSSALEDDFPDTPETLTYTTPRLLHELVAAGILSDTNNATFAKQSAASRDQIWSAAATHVIRARQPNFMTYHMLVTDGLQHKYGPSSPAAYAALALADAQLREILNALDRANIRAQTTLLIVADHGFELSTNIIHPNVLLRQNGLINTNAVSKDPAIFKARVQTVAEGGTAFVYFNDAGTRREDRAQALKLFRQLEGVADIIETKSFASLGFPNPETNPQMGEFVLVAKPNHAFSNSTSGDETMTPVTLTAGGLGNHGYISSNPNMNALFVVVGRGIKAGVKLGVIDNRNVAPTIAHLLGEQFPADGRVLTEILK